ncbi:enoyl-CoA delta isomerase 3, peroxisomal [Bicyclus anynana]|uniref:Enoyl-CoA delta isomerase 3, peroxisomal n=1 Tax=Bicyclus anynana TaxID=110368 RepID=A0ABM3LS63_BICAN|nr:enoyl-CoA delta isomerase 3, peroxisomal [Bicyclus anynana]XP_052741846.1 enoyl-CoA delta isomerase 3, peroxisomal [Bicyclus anynana]XP_052741847.1 enoyl-CoA delta isomerase 3, peroxisomal [Bicyclus anynana]XP_052741848.1 enoyl-CoA delta isomerase 3, peroxisomal [Bicyclus anynana]
MDSETIIETMKDNIKIVRLNKPRRKNAIDQQMFARLTAIINTAATDDNISIVVLTGTGSFYSSGNDLVAPRDADFLDILDEFIKAFITFPKLLIAIVNGPAVGVAVTTLPLCDFVFASENAYFYTPFTKLNIVAEGCSTFTFPRLVGQRKAMDLLMLNYKMPAKEAAECGLVSYLYKPEELQNKVWDKITEISELAEHSVLMTKSLMRRTYTEDLLRTNSIEIEELKKISNQRSKL